MKKWKLLYILIMLGLCLIPSVGMVFTKITEPGDPEEKWPRPYTQEGWNLSWLQEAGEYFEKHFAFRKELVTASAIVQSNVFHVSADDGVISGDDGWLYYMDSLDDYAGSRLMGERELFCVAHSFAMMQEYAKDRGISFLFVPVPNKNTVYGEYMPYYYQYKASEEKNLTGLYKMLDREKVSYVNLMEPFLQTEEMIYHKRDSHWNNKGAAYAWELIMEKLKKPYLSYRGEPYEVRCDFEGDLDGMLFPAAVSAEEEFYYTREHVYSYTGEVESNFDPKILTWNPSETGSLVMYRDSFGNALLPFMADSFGNAYFSRSVPYPLTDLDIYPPDVVVVERAERFLHDMAQNPPVMQAPVRETLPQDAVMAEKTEIIPERSGQYLVLEGMLQSKLPEEDSRIYMRLTNGNMYEAFPVTFYDGQKKPVNGYRMYIAEEEIQVTDKIGAEIFLLP